MSRPYLSGSAKRKLKAYKEESTKKLAGSLLKYTVTVTQKADTSENTVTVSDAPTTTNDAEVSENCKDFDAPTNDATPFEHCKDFDASKWETKNCDVFLKECRDIHIDQNSASSKETFPSNYESDPAVWTIISNNMIDYFIKNPPPQNLHLLPETQIISGGVKRSLTIGNFYHVKKNGEKILRKWLVLSESTKQLFCWVCKIFSPVTSSKNQLTTGFKDWKHVAVRLSEHENSPLHRQAVIKMSQRMDTSQRIDSSLVMQHEEETNYWTSVLKRVVTVVKFLSVRGLPFFGDDETIGSRHNGNFLGCLELIGQFDPFLAGHLEKYGNPGKGNVSYLSSTCVDQFIDVMAKKVLKQITDDVLSAKYFSLIVDSTPDLAHVDQLCFIIRYVTEAQPVERFLKFIPIYSHKAESLSEVVVKTLKDLGIDIFNCRGQSYDNASNMAGKYSGLQARIKSINPMADFIPCSAHSLNLVGVNAVESCSGALQFFSIVQQVYNFFSASTYRWQRLNEEIKKHGKNFTLKSHCLTRWCADAQAVKSLRKNYSSILNVLTCLETDGDQNALTKSEASVLNKKLNKFETVLNIIIWDTLLQRINQTSQVLQSPSLNLSQVAPLYQSLIDFTQFVRNNFEVYEDLARKLCGENKTYTDVRKKSIPRSKDPEAVNNAELQMTVRQAYITKIHYVICDALILHLSQRKTPYTDMKNRFSCFINLKSSSLLQKDAMFLQNYYPSDLADSFSDELQQFSSLVENEDSMQQMLQKLKTLQLEETFPNVETALRIFLTLPVSNCSGERSFSLLKRLKSPIRSTLLQNKLSSLALLCIEAEITEKLNFDDIIHDFACMKARKRITL